MTIHDEGRCNHFVCDFCQGQGCKWCKGHGQYHDDNGFISFPYRKRKRMVEEPVDEKVPVEYMDLPKCRICGRPIYFSASRYCKKCIKEYDLY